MIRSLGSVPIAEYMSANRAACSAFFLDGVDGIVPWLQKYGITSSAATCLGSLPFVLSRAYTAIIGVSHRRRDLSFDWLQPLDDALWCAPEVWSAASQRVRMV